MVNNRRVVKLRRRRSINIGVIIFVILFLYIAINVYLYFTKKHMSIYEVQEGSNIEDISVNGLILRDENVVCSDKAGYVSYLQAEGARISKDTKVFSIDDSNQILDIITSGEAPITLSEENSAELKYEINKFQASYSDSNFNLIYSFKEEAQSAVKDILNAAMIEEGQKIHEETGLANNYELVSSDKSGIVTYYTDSYETVTQDTLTPDSFKTENYKRVPLRTADMISKNSPVYKLVTSNQWSIILPLTKDQSDKLTGKNKVKITIDKDSCETSAALSLFQNGTNYYAKLAMNNYISNYIEDRFLKVTVHMNAEEGLKIPLTALVEKDFYVVPKKYFTSGADSNSKGLIVGTFNEKKQDIEFSFVPTDIYYEDDSSGYIDAKLFTADTKIQLPNSKETYQLSKTGKLTGVYNVNTGYAVFRRVEIIYKNDSYCIAKKDTDYGLSLYDHIALDSSTAVEQKIIY